MSEPQQSPTVLASDLSEDGFGIARPEDAPHGQEEIWVWDLLPGERAQVEIEHRSPHRNRSWARLDERLLPPSPDRQEPHCPAFGDCGGCRWQHLRYPAQLEHKRRHLQAALERVLTEGLQIGTPAAASDETQYRNKGKYVFAEKEGQVVLGAYRLRSHEVVSTLGCQTVTGEIDETARVLAEEVQRARLPIYREGDRKPGLRYAIVRSNEAGEVHLAMVTSAAADAAALASLAERVASRLPNLVGAVWIRNDLESGALLTAEQSVLLGCATLRERVGTVQIELDVRSFWQIHRRQATRVYQDIADAISSRCPKTLELYCGVGAISLTLAQRGLKAHGLERNPEAVASARQAARAHNLDATFELADADQLSASVLAEYDALIVDPPRKGLGRVLRARLCQQPVATLVYLSCGPESLARDLEELVASGYTLESVRAYDFMPGTGQVETLVILRGPSPS